MRQNGVVYREGEVWRTCVDKRTGNTLSRQLVRQNHARVLYDESFLPCVEEQQPGPAAAGKEVQRHETQRNSSPALRRPAGGRAGRLRAGARRPLRAAARPKAKVWPKVYPKAKARPKARRKAKARALRPRPGRPFRRKSWPPCGQALGLGQSAWWLRR